MRYRLRTLLVASTAVGVAAATTRWWYDSHAAQYRREMATMAAVSEDGGVAGWSYAGPQLPLVKRLWEGRAEMARVSDLWCEDVSDLDALAERIGHLERLESLHLLARQLVPRLESKNARDDLLLWALRDHPRLERVVVDATIRGTPEGFDLPIYTREDLAKLEAALPEVRIEWIDVN